MKTAIFISLLFGLLIISCKSAENVKPHTVELNFNFSHLVDAAPVQLDQLIYQNALDQDFSIKTIKYFISEMKLYKADNSVIIFSDIFYVDIRLPETLNYTLSSKIPEGEYSGISFVYGLTPAENITGRFPDQPESLMEWPVPMGGGYHYAKIEGQYITEDQYFNFHSGMLDGTAYEIHVDLKNQPFTVTGSSLDINLKMELQNWFTNPTDWDFIYWGPGIMGNHDAQKTVQENGANVFSFAVVENL
jgi:hypothetical protein